MTQYISGSVFTPIPPSNAADASHSTWLGRHAEWVKEKMVSRNRLERLSAKIWSVAFPIVLGISVIFIYQSYQFYSYLHAKVDREIPLSENPILLPLHSPIATEEPIIVNTDGKEPKIDSRIFKETQGGPGTNADAIKDNKPVINPGALDEPKVYFDGDCINFLQESIYKSYLMQLNVFLNQNHLLKNNIEKLPASPFRESALNLYNHLLNKPNSEKMNREYQACLIENLRAYQIAHCSLGVIEDPSLFTVIHAFDGFIQNYMKDVICYKPSMDFFNQICQEKECWNGQMDELAFKLEAVYQKLDEATTCAGVLPGLYDPFELGNIPYQTFQLYTNEKTIHVFRCPNIVKDEEIEEALLTNASVGEQFKLYLDACRREGKKHLYVNMMYRQIPGKSESLRSRLIEELELEYPGTLNVISLDRNSIFYHQTGVFEKINDATAFKFHLKKHLNSNYYYWTKDLDQIEWQAQLDVIVETIHQCNYSDTETLDLEQRKAFIELTYIKIIEAVLKISNSDNCNFSCKSCIDRGGITYAIMYLYYLFKSQGKINAEQFNYLLYLTFVPALLVGNRPLQKNYFDRLIGFINSCLRSGQAISFPEDDFIYEASVNLEPPLFLKNTKDADLSDVTFEERLNWRLEKFLSRNAVLPMLNSEKRMKIETRYFDKMKPISELIENKIEKSGILVSNARKKEIVEKVTKHYLQTMQYYAPVVALWMDVLIQHVQINDKKMVFLARDGIAFYETAKILLQRQPEKYGGYSQEQMKMAWFSRKSAQDASVHGDLAARYLKQLGIEEEESLIFVDISLTGSIQKKISELITNPIESQFSVSRNPFINGFWDQAADFSLPALSFIVLPPEHPEAWVNDPQSANKWMEDTHRGNYMSAERFVDDQENGLIYPVPSMEIINEGAEKRLVLKETTIGNDVELQDYLIREFGYQAILDFARETSFDDKNFNYDEIKINFNDLLTRIQKGEADAATCKHD